MSEEPRLVSYPWYFDDWRGSEARAAMNGEERNLYRELLDHCWEKGSLPNSEKTLQNLAGIGTREFTRAFKKVKNYFTLSDDGRLHHKKVDEKRKELIGIRLTRQEIAKKAGKASAGKRTSSQHHVNRADELQVNPSPSPSPSTTSTNEGSSVSQHSTDARTNGTHTPGLAIIPAAVNDRMFQELLGAFLHLGVAMSETDTRKCAMLWVSLDATAKRAAHAYATIQATGEWATREGQYVPRPWSYLREKQWERRSPAPARTSRMTKSEAAHNQAAEEFLKEVKH